jgi:hypothetical protein
LLGLSAFEGPETFRIYYWSNEVAILFLLLSLMMSLIFRGLEGVRSRWMVVGAIGVVALLVSLGSTYFEREAFAQNSRLAYAMAMTVVSRNLAFYTALLNMVLWSVLLRQGVRDPQILLVSAGLGLISTGKAIGHSLRGISPQMEGLGNLAVVFTDLLCFAIWYYSFSKVKQPHGKRLAPEPGLKG